MNAALTGAIFFLSVSLRANVLYSSCPCAPSRVKNVVVMKAILTPCYVADSGMNLGVFLRLVCRKTQGMFVCSRLPDSFY